MDIELFDIQGSFTSNRDNWDIGKVQDDLASADGLMLFLSGYDVVTNRLESLKLYSLMTDAISRVREHKDGNVKGRSDVPIWFIITKCDKIPDVSDEIIEEKISPLIQAAKGGHKFGNKLTEKVYTKGAYVHTYMTQAMGKWPDDNTPPLDYEPVNVIEPMEDLLQTMAASRSSYVKKLFMILGIGALAFIIVGGIFLWCIDYYEWQSFSRKVINASSNKNYELAVSELDNYIEPYSLAPQFMRVNRNKNLMELREKVYSDYESSLYAPINLSLSRIDFDRLPDVDSVFLDTSDKIHKYLSVSAFAEISAGHYERIHNAAWYFSAGQLLNPSIEDASPDSIIQIIIRCLNYDAPDSWKNRIQNRIDTLLRRWWDTIPPDSSPSDYDRYINNIEALLNHPNLSIEMQNLINERIDVWKKTRDELWRQLGEKWVRDAYDMQPENGVLILAEHMTDRLNPAVEKMLKDAESNLYNNIANRAVLDYDDDIEALRELLSKFPSMTDDAKEKIEAQIAVLVGIHQENIISEIRSTKSIADLSAMVRNLGGEARTGEIAKTIESVLQNLIDKEFYKIQDEVKHMINQQNFAAAHKFINDRTEALKRDIHRATNEDSSRVYINILDSRIMELTGTLIDAHLSFCKRSFAVRRSTKSEREIVACINDLNEFITLWSGVRSSEQWNEVLEVINFLQVIQGGVRGKLLIVEGNFENVGSWYTFDSNPDIKIEVTINNKTYTSEVVANKKHPKFDFSIPITWNVEMETIEFKGIDENTIRDNQVFQQYVDTSGFKGFEKLTGTLQDSGSSLIIRFIPHIGIPKCPW